MKKTYVFACFYVLLLRCEFPFEPFLCTRKKLVLELRFEITRWYVVNIYLPMFAASIPMDLQPQTFSDADTHKNQNDLGFRLTCCHACLPQYWTL